jgi:hypothetical protein
MNRRIAAWFIAACLCSAPAPGRAETPATQPPSSKSDALTDVARELYEQGGAAYQKKDFEKAYAAYLGAWRLKKHWQIAVNLGGSARKLGKHREAAEYFSYYLREAPKDDSSTSRSDVETALADAKTHVGELRVAVDDAGAEVLVDGEVMGTSPITEPIFVDPGEHSVTVRRDGAVTANAKVTANAGEQKAVTLSAKAAPGPKPRTVPAVIAFSAGGAGLLMGVIGGALAGVNNADLAKKCKPTGACPSSARGELNDTTILTTTSTTGFVLAGVGAAVGVTLLLVPVKATTSALATVQIGPTFVGVRGVF